MSAHEQACEDSRLLCDKLYQCLSRRISHLRCVETQRWCALYQRGRKRFAYLNHRKRLSRVEVWCLGDPATLQEDGNLTVRPRQQTTGGFGKAFQARFFLNNPSQINSACELLHRVSFTRS